MLIDMERAGGRDSTSTPLLLRSSEFVTEIVGCPSHRMMLSQWPGGVRARGKVIVGGLGLGWFLREIAAKDDVESIVVVERTVSCLTGMASGSASLSPRSTMSFAMTCTHKWQHGNDAVYLLDIWPTQACVNSDRQFLSAKRSLGKRIWAGNGQDLIFSTRQTAAQFFSI